MSTINGTGNPRLILIDVNTTLSNPLLSVDLPFCESLIESFDPIAVEHEVQSGINAKEKGWQYSAVLNYEGYFDGDILLEMAKVFEFSKIGDGALVGLSRNLILVPKKDAYRLSYPVIFAGAIDMSMLPENQGHAGIAFKFKGTKILGGIPAMQTNYGTNYGCQGYDFDGSLIDLNSYGANI